MAAPAARASAGPLPRRDPRSVDHKFEHESSLPRAVRNSQRPRRRQRRGVCVRGHREFVCVGRRGRKPFFFEKRLRTTLLRHGGRAAGGNAVTVFEKGARRRTIACKRRRSGNLPAPDPKRVEHKTAYHPSPSSLHGCSIADQSASDFRQHIPAEKLDQGAPPSAHPKSSKAR